MSHTTEWPAEMGDPSSYLPSSGPADDRPPVTSMAEFGYPEEAVTESEIGAAKPEKSRQDEPTAATPFQFKAYADFGASSTKRWLVDRLFGEGETSTWYGPPGSGKSVLVEDMALHIAADLPWFGRAVRHGAVVYIALERHLLVERRGIAFGLHHSVGDLPFYLLWEPIDLRAKGAAERIVATVEEVRRITGKAVVLVVVDTFSRALSGGDENSPKDMGAAVANGKTIQDATGAHVCFVHHTPIDAGERMRGHGVLLGAMDTTFAVAKGAPSRSATIMKANDAEEGQAIAFTLKSVVTGTDENGNTEAPVVAPAEERPAAAPEQRLSKNQQTMFSILHAAGPSGLTTEEWNARARDAGLGKRKADLYDFRSALKAKHVIRQSGDLWMVAS